MVNHIIIYRKHLIRLFSDYLGSNKSRKVILRATLRKGFPLSTPDEFGRKTWSYVQVLRWLNTFYFMEKSSDFDELHPFPTESEIEKTAKTPEKQGVIDDFGEPLRRGSERSGSRLKIKQLNYYSTTTSVSPQTVTPTEQAPLSRDRDRIFLRENRSSKEQSRDPDPYPKRRPSADPLPDNPPSTSVCESVVHKPRTPRRRVVLDTTSTQGQSKTSAMELPPNEKIARLKVRLRNAKKHVSEKRARTKAKKMRGEAVAPRTELGAIEPDTSWFESKSEDERAKMLADLDGARGPAIERRLRNDLEREVYRQYLVVLKREAGLDRATITARGKEFLFQLGKDCIRLGKWPGDIFEYWTDPGANFTEMKYPTLDFMASPANYDKPFIGRSKPGRSQNGNKGIKPGRINEVSVGGNSYDPKFLHPRARDYLVEHGIDASKWDKFKLMAAQVEAKHIIAHGKPTTNHPELNRVADVLKGLFE